MIFSVSSRHRCDVLKKSLAETLTRYYPLAGRIKYDKSVECNETGVDYIEARVVGRAVFQVMQLACSDIEVMESFLPFEPYGKAGWTFGKSLDLNSNALLKIQVNVFDYGGVVICLFYSHMIADGSSFVNFVADWAATAPGGSELSGTHDDEQKVAEVGKPCYMFSYMFPPTTCMSFGDKDSSIVRLEKKCIHEVKANNGSDNIQVDKQQLELHMVKQIEYAVSHVNAVSAPKEVQYVAMTAINLMTRTIPTLPANSFGNMNDVVVAEVSRNLTGSNLGKGFHDQYYPELVSKIRDSIKLVDSEHVKSLQSNFAISCNKLKINQKLGEGTCNGEHKTTEVIRFSSRCSSGDGIEAWVSLKEEHMIAFERHEELLAFAS
ncbi:hypothetical protein MKW92_037077 [Papaver armeniacum]|nr:hypothetical protein MKW92_037077 [Papaver armeniacum]